MAVFASLVLGADGATTKDGSSRGVSSGLDRTSFLERRRLADFILIGGETARTEPYHRTPVPVVISSRSIANSLADNRMAHWWNHSPIQALEKGIKKFGPNVLVEGGARMVADLLSHNALDGIYLSITNLIGGENIIDYETFLKSFSNVSREQVGDTLIIEAKTLK